MIRANHPSTVLLELLQHQKNKHSSSLPRCKTKFVPKDVSYDAEMMENRMVFNPYTNTANVDQYHLVDNNGMKTIRENHQVAPLASRATPLPSRVAPLASRATPLPSRVTPLASRATPLPSRATPLASRATPLASRATPLPSRVTPLVKRVSFVRSIPETESKEYKETPENEVRRSLGIFFWKIPIFRCFLYTSLCEEIQRTTKRECLWHNVSESS
jgi:hypothetical protein